MRHFTYTAEEKENFVLEFKKSGIKPKEFAGVYNISVVSLRNWIKQYEQNGLEGLRGIKDRCK